MNKIVYLFVCVAALQVASALVCYSCNGTGCDKEMKTWEKRTCGSGGSPSDNHQWFCLKLNYKDKITHQPMVDRKCFLTEVKDGKPLMTCPTTSGEPISCPTCQSDICNSAAGINFSFLAFSGVIMAFLAPKFL